jgi:hypothetical protein
LAVIQRENFPIKLILQKSISYFTTWCPCIQKGNALPRIYWHSRASLKNCVGTSRFCPFQEIRNDLHNWRLTQT